MPDQFNRDADRGAVLVEEWRRHVDRSASHALAADAIIACVYAWLVRDGGRSYADHVLQAAIEDERPRIPEPEAVTR